MIPLRSSTLRSRLIFPDPALCFLPYGDVECQSADQEKSSPNLGALSPWAVHRLNCEKGVSLRLSWLCSFLIADQAQLTKMLLAFLNQQHV